MCSIVFYSCKNKGKFWLYPLAIILHTAMDLVAGLYSAKLFNPPVIVLELLIAVFSILTFCGAYFLLYKKDTTDDKNPDFEEDSEDPAQVCESNV